MFYLKFSYIIYRYEIVQRISPESLNDILKKFHEWFPKTSCFEKKFRGPNRKSQRYLEKFHERRRKTSYLKKFHGPNRGKAYVGVFWQKCGLKFRENNSTSLVYVFFGELQFHLFSRKKSFTNKRLLLCVSYLIYSIFTISNFHI